MFLISKIHKNFNYVHVYVHVCYVIVYQDGEGAPSHFGLWYSISKLAFGNEMKHAIFTMKYDQTKKRYKNDHFDARPLRLCI